MASERRVDGLQLEKRVGGHQGSSIETFGGGDLHRYTYAVVFTEGSGWNGSTTSAGTVV